MAMTREEAVRRARTDLAARLGVREDEVTEDSVEDADFPDASFGAGSPGELSAQMITPGWRIRLKAGADSYEYRADGRQLRLYDFKGRNYRI